jgi:hypothetical protein
MSADIYICRFANIFLKQWRRNNMVGSGSAQMVVKIAIIVMLFLQGMF